MVESWQLKDRYLLKPSHDLDGKAVIQHLSSQRNTFSCEQAVNLEVYLVALAEASRPAALQEFRSCPCWSPREHPSS